MADNTTDNPTPSDKHVAEVAAAAATAAVASAQQAPPQDRRVQIVSTLAFALVALVGVLVVLYAWRLPPFTTPIVSTENALVRGQVTLIGTQIAGYVTEVNVQDFQFVKKDELLAKIDDRIYQQRYDQAQAQLAAQKAALANWEQSHRTAEAGVVLNQAVLANAQAQAMKSQADLKRVDSLAEDGSLSLREQDA